MYDKIHYNKKIIIIIKKKKSLQFPEPQYRAAALPDGRTRSGLLLLRERQASFGEDCHFALFSMRGRWGSLFNSFSGQHLLKSSGSFDSSVGLALRVYCKTREGNFKVL